MRHPVPASPEAHYVQAFCSQIVPDAKPLWVQSPPLQGAPEKECFFIVETYVTQFGGRAVVGWAIWETPGVFIEAEFHCIWQDKDSVMHNVTPYAFPVEKLLFLPDNSRTYNGRQVDSFREALVRDQDVIRWLHLAKRRFEISNSGDLADQYGMVKLPPALAREYNRNVDETEKLNKRLDRRYP